MGDPTYTKKVVKNRKTLKQQIIDREAKLIEKAKQVRAEKIKEEAKEVQGKAKKTLKEIGFSDFEIERDKELVMISSRLELAKKAGKIEEIKKYENDLIKTYKNREGSRKIVQEVKKSIETINRTYGTNLSLEKMRPGTPEHDQIFMRIFRMSAAENEKEKSIAAKRLLDYIEGYVKKNKTEP